jgi:hypothetical protein
LEVNAQEIEITAFDPFVPEQVQAVFVPDSYRPLLKAPTKSCAFTGDATSVRNATVSRA